MIRVPLAAPQNAAVVNTPRLMGDPATGQINSLQNANPAPLHPSGIPWGPSPTSDSCHDITVFPALDIAAGACEGNGLLIDISDPANPVRIDEVSDPNWAYWHGATFSNDGTKVIFTDEWGGGTSARCRAQDTGPSWGADAIYEIVNGQLEFRSYYKLPVEQTMQENCVSHLPSLVPVPGRDIITQAWYQGGVSVIDFTDAANPKEIAFYDRGPISGTALVLGGLWSSYYYNGAIYGSEIARGFDVWGLTPNDQLSENEIAAASEIEFERLTPQHQGQFAHAPSFAVVRSYRDQLERAETSTRRRSTRWTSSSTGRRSQRRRQGCRGEGAAQRDREPAEGRRVRSPPRRPARAGGLVKNQGRGAPTGAPLVAAASIARVEAGGTLGAGRRVAQDVRRVRRPGRCRRRAAASAATDPDAREAARRRSVRTRGPGTGGCGRGATVGSTAR